jgi:glycogen phosphorylase
MFRSIDGALWRQVNHNPVAFLHDIDDATLRSSGPHVLAQLARAERSLRDYLAEESPWSSIRAAGLHASPVAYFSAEFCIHESLPIYSGGLGVLAGDHLKSCSDLGIPATGVTLLYRHGYFKQQLEANGQQVEVYQELDTDRVPITRLHDHQGEPLTITVAAGDGSISVEIWQAMVGRCPLILLDVRDCTVAYAPYAQRLYGGDGNTRLIQEIVLGAAGYDVFRVLGTLPAVIHLNEGHCGFAALEAIANRMEETGLTFDDASGEVVESVVFTTHTPVAAGHDRFPPADVLHLLRPLRERLQLSEERFLALGRVDPDNHDEPFCMTVLALKLSRRANGVSSLHGGLSRRMWQSLWPERRASEVPIGHVTNGVHVATWIATELDQLYAECLGSDWQSHVCAPELWQKIDGLDESDLWTVKLGLKQRLIEFIERRERARHERLGLNEPLPALSPEALTIGFARRAAEYKRLMLFLEDIDRVKPLLVDPARPVQIIFAGKAHPADGIGKDLLRRLNELRQQPDLRNHIVFLENYDKNVTRHMLEGCDVWLNNPRRPLEACGTSGMKAIFNACLNCSTLDGWWDEAYDTRNGFAFGKGKIHVDPAIQDAADRDALIEVISGEVVPLFYRRDRTGVPLQWLKRVKYALRTLAWRYNSDRMVIDYAKRLYQPASLSLTAEMRM